MAFDSTLSPLVTATKALRADECDPERLSNKLTRRARQAQSLANRAEAGGPLSSFPEDDELAADVIGAATETAFVTTTPLFKPADDATRDDLVAGTRWFIRATVSIENKNAADTLLLRIRLGDDATPANNVTLTATNATNCATNDEIILESSGCIGAVGASGNFTHYSWNTGSNNFAGVSNAPAAIAFGGGSIDTTVLGLQPDVKVTGVWSSGNAANIAKLGSLVVRCEAPNEALSF
jgi:hypothetical protein